MRRREFAAMAGPSIVVMIALLVVPLVLTLLWSFQDVSYSQAGRWIGVDNYVEALGSARFRDAVLFTVGLTLVTLVLKMVLGYGLALLLNTIRRGRSVLLGMLFVTYVVPTVVGAVVMSWLFNDTFGGLVNWLLSLFDVHINWLSDTWPARALIVLQVVWHELAFPLIILLAGLQGIPKEQVEATAVDGANWLQRQRYLFIPSLRRLFSFIALISMMDGLRIFDAIRVMTPAAQVTGTESIMAYVYDVALGESQRLGLGSAISVLTVIATFVMMIPFLRQVFREVKTS